jgi:hypothetical protein
VKDAYILSLDVAVVAQNLWVQDWLQRRGGMLLSELDASHLSCFMLG